MDALNEEFEEALREAKEKVAKKVPPERAAKRLQALLQRMSEMKFFDPACGSGNFLIISYKRLRELEIRIWKAMNEIGMCTLPFPRIQLRQFYGIELFEYACDTATLSLWLAEHQMNVLFQKELSVNVDTLPLKSSGNIFHNNACRVDWNTICPHTPDEEVYIMGNPPYQGSKMQDKEQKEDMKIAMQGTDATKTLDYIGAWFWLAAKYIRKTKAKYAFVTTNSLTQGEQVAMLWKPIFELGLEISFAYTSFKWSNNAKHNAAVTVVIIGVENKSGKAKILFNEHNRNAQAVENINPYLVASPNLIVSKSYTIPEGLPKAEFGCMPYDNGHLILSPDEKDRLMLDFPISGRFIKPLMGSQEFINDISRYCLWIDDNDRKIAESIQPIKNRILATEHFRQFESKDGASLAERPHQFREHYTISEDSKDKIIVPRVSSERRPYIPIGYVDKDTIISDSAFAIYNAEKWLFALLNTRMHNLWVRAVGGRMKTDLRYSATLCYNTFPFPTLNEEQKDKLSYLADRILDIREEYMDYTPAMLYNPETMPGDLLEAHHRLDLAVERIYRPEPFTSDEERLEHLFKLYAKMTKK